MAPLKLVWQVVLELMKFPFICHAALVMLVLWILALVGVNSLWIYIVSFVYLYHIDKRHFDRTHRRIRSEERKFAYQKKLLSDVETAWWLNGALQKIWPVFLEKFACQEFLMPLAPFFLGKYKPWTARKAVLQSLTLGRTPPMITGMRALEQGTEDDHVVLEACIEFVSADDMAAVLAIQMRKYLAFGLWTTVHISHVHVDGKIRVGVRFLDKWPFISRVRICFEKAPYFQLTARPLFTHSIDVAELPGIASWLDGMLGAALEQSVVAPNILVIDVKKLANYFLGAMRSPSVYSQSVGLSSRSMFMEENRPAAIVHLEILEATQLKPSDANGLADPYVIVVANEYRRKTSIKRKTLSPKWMEEFQIPVLRWESRNLLLLHVFDKDRFHDDDLGYCSIALAEYRDGNRHEIHLPLKGVKTGRLHVAIKVEEGSIQCPSNLSQSKTMGGCDADAQLQGEDHSESFDSDQSGELTDSDAAETSATMQAAGESGVTDDYEEIDFGNIGPGIFSIMRPGQFVRPLWHKRKTRKRDTLLCRKEGKDSKSLQDSEVDESDSEEGETRRSRCHDRKRRFWKWCKFSKENDEFPQENAEGEAASLMSQGLPAEFLAIGEKGTRIRMIVEGNAKPMDSSSPSSAPSGLGGKCSGAAANGGQRGSEKRDDLWTRRNLLKSMARGISKAEKTAHHLGHAFGKGKESDKETMIDHHHATDHVEAKEDIKSLNVDKQDFSDISHPEDGTTSSDQGSMKLSVPRTSASEHETISST